MSGTDCAIGFTIEYARGRLACRLMGWSSEFGGDAFWVERLGRRVAGWAGGLAFGSSTIEFGCHKLHSST